MKIFLAVISLLASSASAFQVGAVGSSSLTKATTISSSALYHAPAPKHDVGENPMADFTPEQIERAQAYMEHQQNVPKPGYPVDVRSLVQYNHGFAVMSTNSKS